MKDTLIAAKALIEDPAHWVKRSLALTREGRDTWPLDDDAHCFCMAGAIIRASNNDSTLFHVSFLFADAVGRDWSIGRYNDAHTHEEVLALFDKLIEAAP